MVPIHNYRPVIPGLSEPRRQRSHFELPLVSNLSRRRISIPPRFSFVCVNRSMHLRNWQVAVRIGKDNSKTLLHQ